MITAIRHKTPAQINTDVSGFAEKYIRDWETWLKTNPDDRPGLFVKTLGKWQVARPKAPLRRFRANATHQPPYMEDILKQASPLIENLGSLGMSSFDSMTHTQRDSLIELWQLFPHLSQTGTTSCVGITKAVLLLTNGRIGPALDSNVRENLRIKRVTNANEWISILKEIFEDIIAFERSYSVKLGDVVPAEFSHLEYGRLYDMALGPRSLTSPLSRTACDVAPRSGGSLFPK